MNCSSTPSQYQSPSGHTTSTHDQKLDSHPRQEFGSDHRSHRMDNSNSRLEEECTKSSRNQKFDSHPKQQFGFDHLSHRMNSRNSRLEEEHTLKVTKFSELSDRRYNTSQGFK